MRLLIVSAYFDSHRGGVERVAGRLATEFAIRDLDVSWLAADSSEPRKILGVKTIPIKSSNWVQEKTGVPMPLWKLQSFGVMLNAVKNVDVVMLHDTLYIGNIASYLAALWYKKPVVVVQHVGRIKFHKAIFNLLMALGDRFVGRPMLARSSQTVFISERIAAEYDGVSYRVPRQVVFNAVDSAVFDPAKQAQKKSTTRDAHGIRSDAPTVLFAGRFVPRKGLALVRKLAEARPDVVFLLAGWGPIDPSQWGLRNVRITVVDTPQEMASLYAASDALLLPSSGEGFPLVVQEALSMGLRVVCSTETIEADRALKDVVAHARFDPENPDADLAAWCDALAEVLKPEAESAATERSAFAKARYGVDATITKYQSILEQVNVGGSP